MVECDKFDLVCLYYIDATYEEKHNSSPYEKKHNLRHADEEKHNSIALLLDLFKCYKE